jgi:cbb3-type cytochrome c oxidase subunit III
MASLRYHVAPLLAFALVAGCGGDHSRTAAGADTTGAAAVTPDSAAMHAGTTAAPAATDTARSAAADTSGKTSATDTGAKHATATPPAKKKTPVAKAKPTEKPESTSSAAAPAPAPAPQQQDTSKATAAAEQPLRDAYHQAPKDTVSEAVYDGWKQFNLNCARCHGEDVLGTTIAPHLIMSLKPTGPINSKELFVQTVCAGRPEKGMPSWCALGLDMSKINDIYEYVKGRSDAKISPGRPAVKQQG